MNERINLQDLSALLAEKAAITKKEAETFLREYFEIMSEELIKDESLKIKDLGTFKLLRVENRESINVTTGERVLIPAHFKVAFTPDKKLAETVNEPFAFFETVEIEDESVLGELEMLPEKDVSEESEPIPDYEEIITVEEKSIPEIDEKMIVENEPILEKENITEEKPVAAKELLLEKNEESHPEEESVYDRGIKNSCHKCHDYEAHHIYRRKYFVSWKKVRRLRATVWILSVLLLAAVGYIAFIQFGTEIVSLIKAPHFDDTVRTGIKIAPAPQVFETIDSVEINEPVEEEIAEEKPLPEISDETKHITITPGQRLTSIALEEYGNKVFWIYIYLENKAVISNPNVVPVGMKITIPPAGKYGIDCNNPESVQKAKDLISKKP